MTRRKIIKLSMLCAIIFCFIIFSYFPYGISSKYPPMKENDFLFNTTQLKNKIINIAKAHTNLNFKITDSAGLDQANLNYYAEINIKDNGSIYEFIFFIKSLMKKIPD